MRALSQKRLPDELDELCRALRGHPRLRDVRHSTADLRLSASGLGYVAEVALGDGLVRTREHYTAMPVEVGAAPRRTERPL